MLSYHSIDNVRVHTHTGHGELSKEYGGVGLVLMVMGDKEENIERQRVHSEQCVTGDQITFIFRTTYRICVYAWGFRAKINTR